MGRGSKQGRPKCCAGQHLKKPLDSFFTLLRGSGLYNLCVQALAYSWDQNHGAISAVCEAEGFPGSSCSGEMGVQARESGYKARASWSQPGVQPALLPLPVFCELPGKPLIAPACPEQGKWEGL